MKYLINDYVVFIVNDREMIGLIKVRNSNNLLGNKTPSYDILVDEAGEAPLYVAKHVPETDIRLLANGNTVSWRALELAIKHHIWQKDLAGKPYVLHLSSVGLLVRKSLKNISEEDSDKILSVAYLHDILEDTFIIKEDLIENFGEEIANAVDCITKRKNENYENYINRVKQNNLARIVKICDLEHNSDISRIGNPTKRDLERQKKYKQAISKLIMEE